MKIILEYTLWILVAVWFVLILSIFVIAVYAVIFPKPDWLKAFFTKESFRCIKRIFMILALSMGVAAVLLSIANSYK
jgi:hypothetical protein